MTLNTNTVQEQTATTTQLFQTPWTNPLTPAEKELVAAELNALQQNPINGWDKEYTALFIALNERIVGLAERLKKSSPAFIIHFQGVFNNQAAALIIPDGKKRMLIGADFIRKYLLGSNEAQAKQEHEIFIWSIAHELGHLTDPLFISFTKHTIWYNLAPVLAICLVGQYAFGATSIMSQIFIGIIVSQLGAIGIAFLRQKMELNADAIGMDIINSIDLDLLKTAILEMRTLSLAEQSAEQQAALCKDKKPGALGHAVYVFKKVNIAYANWLGRMQYPSIEKRIACMTALVKKA